MSRSRIDRASGLRVVDVEAAHAAIAYLGGGRAAGTRWRKLVPLTKIPATVDATVTAAQVRRYVKAVKAGTVPPIIILGDAVFDGSHRVACARRAGHHEIAAVVYLNANPCDQPLLGRVNGLYD